MRSESLDTTLPIVPTDSTTNNNINLFQNDNTVNINFLQNSSTDTIDNKEIVYIYITPSSAPVQVPIIISVVVNIIICMAVTMTLMNMKSLIIYCRDCHIATELQQNSNKKEDIELVDNQAYSLVVIKNTENDS